MPDLKIDINIPKVEDKDKFSVRMLTFVPQSIRYLNLTGGKGVFILRKFTLSLILTLGMLLLAAVNTPAADLAENPVSHASTTGSLYGGTFYGYVHGDNASQAQIALKLEPQDETFRGYVYLGEGLYVDGGICGGAYVPAGVQLISGEISPGNPNQLTTTMSFTVKNMDVSVDLIGELSADGEVLTAQAAIDLPWICARDPSLLGTLSRVE
jgi:hypothetical protein